MDNLPRLLLYPLYTQSQTKTNHTMEFKKNKDSSMFVGSMMIDFVDDFA